MTSLLSVLHVALATIIPVDLPSPDDCIIRVNENANFVTLQAVVSAERWDSGAYNMIIETQQGGNRSLSRQAGVFDNSKMAQDGLLVLSSTTVYASSGSRIVVNLDIDGGIRKASCSLNFYVNSRI